MPDIFLSYSRDDQTTARRFAGALERAGFSVWGDQTLIAGEAFDEATERPLEGAGAVVVLWSKKSVASRWVRAEATQANERGKLVPVMIEPCKRPIMFELTHTADLSKWKGDDNDPAWHVDRREDPAIRIWALSWFVQLGALDQAYRIGNELQQEYEARTPAGAGGRLWAREMSPFRGDTRFQEFVTRLGMMPYWEKHGPPDDCDLKAGKLVCT